MAKTNSAPKQKQATPSPASNTLRNRAFRMARAYIKELARNNSKGAELIDTAARAVLGTAFTLFADYTSIRIPRAAQQGLARARRQQPIRRQRHIRHLNKAYDQAQRQLKEIRDVYNGLNGIQPDQRDASYERALSAATLKLSAASERIAYLDSLIDRRIAA